MTEIVYNKNGVAFDIDALATDVNGKADKDLTNTTPSDSFISMFMPDYNQIESKSNNTEYTATTNGWLIISTWHAGTTLEAIVQIDGVTIIRWDENYTAYNWKQNCILPISKDSTYKLVLNAGGAELKFVPMKGQS